MIPFNRPAVTGKEKSYINRVFERNKFAGGGEFSNACNKWLKKYFSVHTAFTTTSCTHSLEMAAILCELGATDEVILPSFAFSSTATSFLRTGARLVFVDIDPDTMNVSPSAIEQALTERTKVIVCIHYAGVSCDMDALSRIANDNNLVVVEDAAQAIFSKYRNQYCGTIGDYGCFSFHESKNIQCGEGGAFLCNKAESAQRSEIILEKGTNRRKFFRGEVDKYTWLDEGSSYVLGELNSAFLLAQLEHGQEITRDRVMNWNSYYQGLSHLHERGFIQLPNIPADCEHNGHTFWIKTHDLRERNRLIKFLSKKGIHSVFHYIPLHSSPAGRKFGVFRGADTYTTSESEKLLRLPMYYQLTDSGYIIDMVQKFYK